MSVGIYRISNKQNNKSYIGQSVNIERRWVDHKRVKDIPEVSHYPLYRAFNKYGLDNFIFEIIEECDIEDLNKKEKKWIEYYDSFFNGYNQTLGGTHQKCLSSKPQIIGIIKDLEETDLYHYQIAEKWKISTEMVQGINTGRYWKQNREYPIQKNSKEFKNPKSQVYCIDCGIEITDKATRCIKCQNIKTRKVERPDRETLKYEIRNFSFLHLSKQYKVSDNAIRKWCKTYNLPYKKKEIKQYSNEEWLKV